jgi:hypothetical protein
LESRVTELEKVIRPAKKAKLSAESQESQYKGLTGGIYKLVDGNFFDTPKLVKDVKSELERHGYYYTIQSVNKAMYSDFMKNKNLFTRVGKRGEWKYVLRK